MKTSNNPTPQRFWEKDLLGSSQAQPRTLAETCRQMAFLLEAGVPLKSALAVVGKDANPQGRLRNSSPKRLLQAHLQATLDGVLGGVGLSQALAQTGYFPKFMCSMCRLGEASDNLAQIMAHLSDYYEQRARTTDEIKSAMLYPAMVAAMMLVMIIVAVLYVLPQYALIFEASGAPLPAMTRGLLALSDLLIGGWYWVLPVLGILATLPIIFVRSSFGRPLAEKALLYAPPLCTLYRRTLNLHLVQALAMLLHSNLPLVESVRAVSGISPNAQVRADLLRAATALEQGEGFWQQLAAIPYIDRTLVSMACVGEETGDLSRSLAYASDYCRHRFDHMARRLNKLVEPVITLILGLILGAVMLSIVLPAFTLTELVV